MPGFHHKKCQLATTMYENNTGEANDLLRRLEQLFYTAQSTFFLDGLLDVIKAMQNTLYNADEQVHDLGQGPAETGCRCVGVLCE